MKRIEKKITNNTFVEESIRKMGLVYLKPICGKLINDNEISIYTDTRRVMLVHGYQHKKLASRIFSHTEYVDYLDDLPANIDILEAMLTDLFEII